MRWSGCCLQVIGQILQNCNVCVHDNVLGMSDIVFNVLRVTILVEQDILHNIHLFFPSLFDIMSDIMELYIRQ